MREEIKYILFIILGFLICYFICYPVSTKQINKHEVQELEADWPIIYKGNGIIVRSGPEYAD